MRLKLLIKTIAQNTCSSKNYVTSLCLTLAPTNQVVELLRLTNLIRAISPKEIRLIKGKMCQRIRKNFKNSSIILRSRTKSMQLS